MSLLLGQLLKATGVDLGPHKVHLATHPTKAKHPYRVLAQGGVKAFELWQMEQTKRNFTQPQVLALVEWEVRPPNRGSDHHMRVRPPYGGLTPCQENVRSIKVTPKERRELAARLLGAFKVLVTAQGAHDQLALEKKGWFPSKTTSPSGSLIDAGLVEQMNRGKDKAVYYYRLTARGKKALLKVRIRALLREHPINGV